MNRFLPEIPEAIKNNTSATDKWLGERYKKAGFISGRQLKKLYDVEKIRRKLWEQREAKKRLKR